MSDGAAGTVTLVFTDIEGSTRLLQNRPSPGMDAGGERPRPPQA